MAFSFGATSMPLFSKAASFTSVDSSPDPFEELFKQSANRSSELMSGMENTYQRWMKKFAAPEEAEQPMTRETAREQGRVNREYQLGVLGLRIDARAPMSERSRDSRFAFSENDPLTGKPTGHTAWTPGEGVVFKSPQERMAALDKSIAAIHTGNMPTIQQGAGGGKIYSFGTGLQPQQSIKTPVQTQQPDTRVALNLAPRRGQNGQPQYAY